VVGNASDVSKVSTLQVGLNGGMRFPPLVPTVHSSLETGETVLIGHMVSFLYFAIYSPLATFTLICVS